MLKQLRRQHNGNNVSSFDIDGSDINNIINLLFGTDKRLPKNNQVNVKKKQQIYERGSQ